jgi:hypothetical protein
MAVPVCMKCGNPRSKGARVCPSCGHIDDKYLAPCRVCGTLLESAAYRISGVATSHTIYRGNSQVFSFPYYTHRLCPKCGEPKPLRRFYDTVIGKAVFWPSVFLLAILGGVTIYNLFPVTTGVNPAVLLGIFGFPLAFERLWKLLRWM